MDITRRLSAIAGLTLMIGSPAGFSQSRQQTSPSVPPAFEVASVKLDPVIKGETSKIMNPGGLIYTRVALTDCIQAAYGVKSHQVLGPDWIRTERYDINARADGSPNNAQLMLMLQTLLADRFKLQLHREQRELPVYLLNVTKGGHKLRPNDGNGPMKVQFARGGMTFQEASIADLMQFLTAFSFDRPILDNTALDGRFDFTLSVGSPDGDPGEMKRALAQGGPAIFMDALAPLGLKLEPQKTATEVLVVDHAERPAQQ